MYRSTYDTDVITWSPQGRVYQIEYAMEAVRQGTCGIGARSNTHVVLCGLRRAANKLAAHNRKILEVDEHIGASFAGITADAKILTEEMRHKCLHHKLTFGSPIQVQRLVIDVADRSQKNTQLASRRPFGVGLLIAGYDSTGPHLFETCPSGNFYEYYAHAFGARCQSARTFLEKHLDDLAEYTPEELIVHALKALRSSLESDQQLTLEKLHVAIVGKDQPFKELTAEELERYLDISGRE
ncbi:MAG: uncharacterized protein KVP18_003624 [Porospora cf. gigantea A]|uniref:uncharacterized protein n=2 Tax=Porospora cf. gigantea A TaxID=2853593 RepID=UPI0035596E8C|nr:MAG: hypothetical protein KVP18_003624 [Porospora cf. gigantea A]